MAEQRDSFTSSYDDESFTDALVRNFKTKPAAMTSILGLIGACSYGAYRYKTKGMTFTPSLFLIQLRVGAQATVVGCLTLAMVYRMVDQHILKKDKEQVKE